MSSSPQEHTICPSCGHSVANPISSTLCLREAPDGKRTFLMPECLHIILYAACGHPHSLCRMNLKFCACSYENAVKAFDLLLDQPIESTTCCFVSVTRSGVRHLFEIQLEEPWLRTLSRVEFRNTLLSALTDCLCAFDAFVRVSTPTLTSSAFVQRKQRIERLNTERKHYGPLVHLCTEDVTLSRTS